MYINKVPSFGVKCMRKPGEIHRNEYLEKVYYLEKSKFSFVCLFSIISFENPNLKNLFLVAPSIIIIYTMDFGDEAPLITLFLD